MSPIDARSKSRLLHKIHSRAPSHTSSLSGSHLPNLRKVPRRDKFFYYEQNKKKYAYEVDRNTTPPLKVITLVAAPKTLPSQPKADSRKTRAPRATTLVQLQHITNENTKARLARHPALSTLGNMQVRI